MFCDVEFVVGEEEIKIPAHLAIVAARSQWLRARIRQARDAREKHLEKVYGTTQVPFKDLPLLEVKLLDAVPEAFEMVLNYVYTDRIEPRKKVEEECDNRVVLLMMDVYRLAVQFSMKRLEQLCEQYLETTISVLNVLDAVSNAHTLGLLAIKEFCLRFIVKDQNYAIIVMSKEFECLDQTLMVEIVRRKQYPANVSRVVISPVYDSAGNSIHTLTVEK